MWRKGFFLLLLCSISSVFVQAQGNLTECVSTYDDTVDYFPDQVTVEYAQNFSVEYHANYKVITVNTPFPGATPEDAQTYVLVQCGTPAPEDVPAAQVIPVPVQSVMALSTVYLPHLKDLGVLDTLVGMDTLLYTNTPEVIEMGAAGKIAEVGSGSAINMELVLETAPELVLTYSNGVAEYDSDPALIAAGIPTIITSDWLEQNPLGRAEWLKFTALFYNAEAEANTLFAERTTEYQALQTLTADLTERPLVLWESFTTYGNAWYIPGADSYVAQLLKDAGVEYVLQDAPEAQDLVGSAPFDFEVVYEAGLDADFWIPGAFAINSVADLLAQDERYGDFAPVTNQTVYALGARMNANGGDDYYESGVSNPQIVLADLIAIFHPDLLPEHELYFYRQLQ